MSNIIISTFLFLKKIKVGPMYGNSFNLFKNSHIKKCLPGGKIKIYSSLTQKNRGEIKFTELYSSLYAFFKCHKNKGTNTKKKKKTRCACGVRIFVRGFHQHFFPFVSSFLSFQIAEKLLENVFSILFFPSHCNNVNCNNFQCAPKLATN